MARLLRALGLICVTGIVACGAGAPKQAKEPEVEPQEQKAAASPEAPGKSDMPAASESKEAKAEEAKAAEAKPKEPEIPMSKEDPGDSGAVQLGPEHAKKVVATNQPFLAEYCWTKAMKENPKGPKKVRLATEVEVNPDGTAKNVKVVGGKDYAGLSDCVEKHMKLWKYPRAKKQSSLMFPIILEHKDVETLVK